MTHAKKAMTIVEIILALAIIGIVLVSLVGVIRPKILNKDYYKIRATIYNLQKVDELLLAEQRSKGSWSYGDSVNDVCMLFIDTINLKKEIGCNTKDKNFVMANGVSVSGFTGAWQTPSDNIKHPYIDFTFDVNDEKGENKSGVDIFTVRIFKDEAVIVPVTPALLTSTDITKFRVITKREKQNSTYVETYKIVDEAKDGVSYGEAACITGIADEFLTESEKQSITNCSRNTSACDRYFDCSIQIMDIPSSIVTFKGEMN